MESCEDLRYRYTNKALTAQDPSKVRMVSTSLVAAGPFTGGKPPLDSFVLSLSKDENIFTEETILVSSARAVCVTFWYRPRSTAA
jgi:hypothetical protein